jgi:hypothetical protein
MEYVGPLFPVSCRATIAWLLKARSRLLDDRNDNHGDEMTQVAVNLTYILLQVTSVLCWAVIIWFFQLLL